ncbi:LppP/LprE lipoprotein [Dyella jiangningensis]|nr:LppP/LprE lipoprotein [Dyella sp. AtDHG13]SDJ31996.1 LppP/LprE lipoprotein [Dyella jiangningensis]
MGMDHRCLVLSGRLLEGQDAAAVHERMAAAFGMEMAGFRERVFARAPLIIRRGLDDATADMQAAQLRGMGAEADVWPDSDRLIWLRRDNQVRGPLPEDSLSRYAEAGDQWCHDGGQTWFAWTPEPDAEEPPPLPPQAHGTAADAGTTEPRTHAPASHEPPPLPVAPAAAPAKKSFSFAAIFAALVAVLALAWHPVAPFALLLAVCALVYLKPRPALQGRAVAVLAVILSATALLMWMHRPAPAPVAQAYVPRPLKPLSQNAPGAATGTQCLARTATPKNDEDRFLLTGERLLTGRAQRKGDTYVAEAAVAVDEQCQPSAMQLYVFHNGVFIGTVLDTAASMANTKLADFDLVDDQHLRVTYAACTDKPAACAATTVRQFAVMPGGGGWTLGEMK